MQNLTGYERKLKDFAERHNSSSTSPPKKLLNKQPSLLPESPSVTKENSLSCYVRTQNNHLSTRFIQIDGNKLGLWQMKKGELVMKLSKDVSVAQVTLDLPTLTEKISSSRGKVGEGVTVYPITIKFPQRVKLILFFTKEIDRQGIIGKILETQGFGSQIQQYQLLECMGKTSLKAMHKSSGKKFLVKVVQSQNNGTENQDILSQIHLHSMIDPLQQDGLMRLTEYIIEDDFTYLIRPYYNLGNLCQAISSFRVNLLTENEILEGAYTLCQALDTIHRVGYVHGDVRPQNIFMDGRSKQMTISLGDYDFCQPIGAQADQQPLIDQDASLLLYMAPEVIRTMMRTTTPASEVWSMGVTLFVLATGSYPFTDLSEIREANLVWPRATPLSKEFKSMVTSMLNSDEYSRPSMNEIVNSTWFTRLGWDRSSQAGTGLDD